LNHKTVSSAVVESKKCNGKCTLWPNLTVSYAKDSRKCSVFNWILCKKNWTINISVKGWPTV